jgi:hypothetical protein
MVVEVWTWTSTFFYFFFGPLLIIGGFGVDFVVRLPPRLDMSLLLSKHTACENPVSNDPVRRNDCLQSDRCLPGVFQSTSNSRPACRRSAGMVPEQVDHSSST